MQEKHIFVSYSRRDEEFVRRLVADLTGAGALVWVDMEKIGAGNFQQRINDALAASEWVVLVLTPDALASEWVRQEIDAANRLRNQQRICDIVLIEATKVDQNIIPPLWATYNIIDATENYVLARDDVLRALDLPVGSSCAVPPASADSLVASGKLLADKGMLSEAQTLFEQAVAIDPDNAVAWSHKAEVLASTGFQDEAALAACERALVLDPSRRDTWQTKGWALCGLQRHQEALDAFERGCDSHEYGYWRGKAQALRGLGRVAEAEEADRMATTLISRIEGPDDQ